MKKDINKKKIIGFSIGDYNGIGPEILIKSFLNSNLFDRCIPIVFCEKKILEFYNNLFNYKLEIKEINNFKSEYRKNIIYTYNNEENKLKIEPGHISKSAGNYSIKSLNKSVNSLDKKKIDGLVTLPISKINSQSDLFSFPGHTEFLKSRYDIDDNIMIMYSKIMIIGFHTGHIPLNEVSSYMNNSLIENKLKLFINTLKNDFNIKFPKIAVLGLNPHSGENGMLGTEELNKIVPITNKLKNKENQIEGPFPADSFFGSKKFQNYDGVFSWYHDQGLVGFKSFSFENGVNYTGGLPIIRTSPDHGTAFNIAGKGIANNNSLTESVKLNIQIINQRIFSK